MASSSVVPVLLVRGNLVSGGGSGCSGLRPRALSSLRRGILESADEGCFQSMLKKKWKLARAPKQSQQDESLFLVYHEGEVYI